MVAGWVDKGTGRDEERLKINSCIGAAEADGRGNSKANCSHISLFVKRNFFLAKVLMDDNRVEYTTCEVMRDSGWVGRVLC